MPNIHMTYDQTLLIARRIGRLRNQADIDLQTFLTIISELEDAIRAKSRVLDDANHLHQFRSLIRGDKKDANVL